MYILAFTFFGSLRSREVSSNTFCIVENKLHLLYPFSGVHFGTRELESRRQVVQYLLIFCLKDHKLRVVLLLTESLLLAGDVSTIFQGV